jgi:hypothetical protein
MVHLTQRPPIEGADTGSPSGIDTSSAPRRLRPIEPRWIAVAIIGLVLVVFAVLFLVSNTSAERVAEDGSRQLVGARGEAAEVAVPTAGRGAHDAAIELLAEARQEAAGAGAHDANIERLLRER